VNPNQEPEAQAMDMPVAGHQVVVEDPLSMAATGAAAVVATPVECLLRSLPPGVQVHPQEGGEGADHLCLHGGEDHQSHSANL
jgi:hypothetical protein